LVAAGLGSAAMAQDIAPAEVLVSIKEQKLAVIRNGGLVARYPISTSKFGVGDSFGSYQTPVGRLRVCDKIGGNLAPGAVLNHRQPTGEILRVNAPGRDPIVTRVIWLDGLEPQNANARSRGIYIHGTAEERRIGDPVSWGCIRMRSQDVIDLFDTIEIGTTVTISTGRLPKLPKYHKPKPIIIAVQAKAPAPASSPASHAASAKEPPRVAVQTEPATPVSRPSVKPTQIAEGPSDSRALQAMKGSILLAGLPESGSVFRRSHRDHAAIPGKSQE
jgi:hypothetical protein